MVVRSTRCIGRLVDGPNYGKIEDALAVDVLNQSLKALTDCYAILNLDRMAVVSTIIQLPLAVREQKPATKHVEPCC